jgi:MYXO-CTERM domain-containing protein
MGVPNMSKVIVALAVSAGIVSAGIAGESISPDQSRSSQRVSTNDAGVAGSGPESNNWVLMLSGLGLMGAVIRRRTKGRAE